MLLIAHASIGKLRGRTLRATRPTIVLCLLTIVGAVFFLSGPLFGIDGGGLARTWIAQAQGPWALMVVIGVFAGLAFVGVPQVALIAAAVAILGPWRGGGYAWIATMVSAMLGFGVGRLAGVTAAGAFEGARHARFTQWVGANGMLASLIVRLVPLAPFPLINIAAGVARVTVFDFVVGTGIGIVPKIALTAFAGETLMRWFMGGAR